MSEIQSINYNIPAIYSTQRRAVQNSQNIDRKIVRIDREIQARENFIKSNDEVISLTKDLLQAHKEHRQLIQESKALGEKRIVLLQESKSLDRERINALYTLIDGLQGLLDRNKGTNVAPALSKDLEALSKKDAILKEQTAVIDNKAAKLAIKVEHQGKELAKLGSNAPSATTTENQAVIVSSKDTSQVVQVYQPTTDQVRSIALAKTQQNSDKILQQNIINSQQNIYESITNKRKGAEVTKPANVLDSDAANTLNIRQETIDRNIKFTRPIIEAKLQEYPSLNSDKLKLKASELISNKYSNIDLSKNQTRLNLFRLNLDNIISLLLK